MPVRLRGMTGGAAAGLLLVPLAAAAQQGRSAPNAPASAGFPAVGVYPYGAPNTPVNPSPANLGPGQSPSRVRQYSSGSMGYGAYSPAVGVYPYGAPNTPTNPSPANLGAGQTPFATRQNTSRGPWVGSASGRWNGMPGNRSPVGGFYPLNSVYPLEESNTPVNPSPPNEGAGQPPEANPDVAPFFGGERPGAFPGYPAMERSGPAPGLNGLAPTPFYGTTPNGLGAANSNGFAPYGLAPTYPIGTVPNGLAPVNANGLAPTAPNGLVPPNGLTPTVLNGGTQPPGTGQSSSISSGQATQTSLVVPAAFVAAGALPTGGLNAPARTGTTPANTGSYGTTSPTTPAPSTPQ